MFIKESYNSIQMRNDDKIILERMFYVVIGTSTCIFLCVYFGKENLESVLQIMQPFLIFLGGFGLGKSTLP
ncbi:MAG: hypothetical protein JWM14_456 [Chitinophagaceae bacterium]|nr:hypothetical protein [Chitinophagaceae bacterium]